MRGRGTTMRRLLALTVLAVALPAAAAGSARSQLLYSRGLIPHMTGRWEEAYRLFDAAVHTDDQDALALFYRGRTAGRLGFYNVAIRDIERARALRPDLEGADLDLGILYLQTGRLDQAQPLLEAAYETPPSRFSAALFLGLLHLRQGDAAQARTYLETASLDPALDAPAEYYLGLLASRAGDDAAARERFAAVREAVPASPAGRAAAAYLGEDVPLPPPRRGAEPAAPMGRWWTLRAATAVEYDTNILLAPDDGALQESRDAEDHDGARIGLSAGAGLRLWDRGPVRLAADYDLYQSFHLGAGELEALDLQAHRVRVDLAGPRGRVEYGIGGVYDFYLRDFETYYQQVMGLPWVTYRFTDDLALQAYYRIRARDFLDDPFDPARDGFNNAVGLRQFVRLGTRGVLRIGYQFDDDNSISDAGDELEYLAHQLDAVARFPVADVFDATLGYLVRLEDYDEPNSRRPVRRHDVQQEVVIGAQRNLTDWLGVHLRYIAVINDSNIDPFEYDRHVVSFGVRAEL